MANLMPGATLIDDNAAGGFAPANLTDEDTGNSCFFFDGAYAIWDLGASYTLTNCAVLSGPAGEGSRHVTVTLSPNEDLSGGTDVVDEDFHGDISNSFSVAARYVRILVTGGGAGDLDLAELQLEGSPAAANIGAALLAILAR